MITDQWAVSVPVGYRFGRWQVTAPLGSGSWGSVYEARRIPDDGEDRDGEDRDGEDRDGEDRDGEDRDGEDTVAVKFLPTRVLNARSLRQLTDMAERETEAHNRLAHPGIIRRIDSFVIHDERAPALDGAVAVVMERARRSLADAPVAGGPDPPAARIVAEICAGLTHMHTHGWVHGDLKPGNVLVMADGSIRLADFGLATELEGTHGYVAPAGSAEYSPPERWSEPISERGTAIRPSADIWALGVSAHQLATGRSPFPGPSGQARAAAAAEYAAGHAELSLAADLPTDWRRFIGACLRREPTARPDAAQVSQWARSLGPVPAEVTTAADPTQTCPQATVARRVTRRRLRLAGALGAAIAAAAGFAVGIDLLATAPDGAGTNGDDAGIGGAGIGGAGAGAERDAAAAADSLPRDAGIPVEYRDLVVEAGTMCARAGMSPILVAAMLEAESGFDPDLADPANDEYGIARWTPRVLAFYLPGDRRGEIPEPPFSPAVSIPAMGRYLCDMAPRLSAVPGEAALNLAAAYRTSVDTVVEADGVPIDIRPYAGAVAANIRRYTEARNLGR